jgi:hypothetical protein
VLLAYALLRSTPAKHPLSADRQGRTGALVAAMIAMHTKGIDAPIGFASCPRGRADANGPPCKQLRMHSMQVFML